MRQNQDQVRENLNEIRDRLTEVQDTITQSRCNIDERKENAIDEEEQQQMHQNQYQQHNLIKVQSVENSMLKNIPAIETAIDIASGRTERNLLIDMERTFEASGKSSVASPNP
jgi:hypothetical protein